MEGQDNLQGEQVSFWSNLSSSLLIVLMSFMHCVYLTKCF